MLPLLLLSACTHDDGPASPAGDPLPSHAYPLQIGSITVTADSQPLTRLADEGNTTKWKEGDQIMVSLGDKQSVYTYTGREWHSDHPLCWESTAPQEVNAWYPVTDEIDFTQQNTKGLTYLLKATPVTASYEEPSVNLTFTHQLAKVRVLLEGEKAEDVEKVYVRSHPTSTHTQGKLGGLPTGSTAEYVPMYKTTYEGKECWEATLRNGTLQADNSFQVAAKDGTPVQVTLTDDIPIKAGEVYTINISVNPVIPENATDITNVTGNINDRGDYVVRNNYDKTINITGGSPTIYLDGATVSVGSGSAINITNNATPTIYVVGENNTISSGNGAGIYVAENSSVTITGRSREDVLTARGGNGGSGIGGYQATCGDIEISNMTVHAHGSDEGGDFLSAGIGGSGDNGCGTITIDNATISAYGASDGAAGNMSSPGIGGGLYGDDKGTYSTITIKNNSQVSVQRGSPNGIDATVDETSTVTKLN